MSSYLCLKTRSDTMKCGRSHTTTCTCRSEADAPWGRNVMLTSTPNQASYSTLSRPSNWRNCSHRRQTMPWLRIHTSLNHISTPLAMRYQTCQLTPMTFPR